MLVWLFQLVVGEIIHASEMTQYGCMCSNFSCFVKCGVLEFQTTCTYFIINLQLTATSYYILFLYNETREHGIAAIKEVEKNTNEYKYDIRKYNANLFLIQLNGSNFFVNYFECLLPDKTLSQSPSKSPLETPYETPSQSPIETPIASETPSETPSQSPSESPSETPLAKRSSSKNKYIIGFTVGFGCQFIIIIITVILYLRKKKKQVNEEIIVDDIQFPEDDSKKEDEQENPLYVLNGSHDPFDEITE